VEPPSFSRWARQWIVSDGDPKSPERSSWKCYELAGRKYLLAHPDLAINQFNCPAGRLFILGICTYQTSPAAIRCESELHSWLNGATGVYVLVSEIGSEVRIYTDPCSMSPVFFTDGMATSSPSLIPNLRRSRRLDDEYRLRGTDDWYPGTLTPFVNVKALPANHHLDVSSGRYVRFWPTQASNRITTDSQAIDEIANELQKSVEAVVHFGHVILSLTGGKDSRVNLAAARRVLNHVKIFTIITSGTKACDIEIPKKICRAYALPHSTIICDGNPEPLERAYDEIAAGMALGARRQILSACAQAGKLGNIHLSGNMGGIAKAYFWPSLHPAEPTAKSISDEFVSGSAVLKRSIQDWLDTTPDGMPNEQLLNLMYFEQRGSRWMGIGENASNLFYQPFTPFCSRRVFELISACSNELIYRGDVHDRVIERLWPELQDIEYCPPARKTTRVVPKAVRRLIKRLSSKPYPVLYSQL